MIHLICSCSFTYTDNYLINYKKNNLYSVRVKLMVFNCDFVYNDIECCATKILRFYLWAPKCSGRGGFYTLAIVINPSWVLSGTGLIKCQVIRSLLRTCSEPILNITHWSHHQFPITNLDLLIYGCICIESYARTQT